VSGAVVDEDALYVELSQSTNRSAQDWKDILAQPPEARASILADWKALGDMSWATIPSTVDRVEAILNVLAAIATPVSTIVGGATGVATLVSAIKAL
jgi:hypothetical protein